MFGDDSTNKEFLLNGLNIAIIDKKIVEHELCNSLIKKLKDDSSSVNISTLSTVDELYKEISQNICDTSSCLLNMQWIDLVYNIRPSVMILFYYIVDVNLKDEEENNLSKIIDNIRSSDQNLPIYLFIIIPVQEYDKYQHLKGDEKNFNILKRKMNKENFFIYSSKDVIKNNDLKKLNENIISNSRNYYRQTKNLLKNKIKNAKYKEEQIKYLIMTAILSIVKTKRKYPCCSKHLNKAYYLILAPNFNFKEYYYGNSDNSVQNFYEIRSIADWLLFKILILNNKRNEETNKNIFKEINDELGIDNSGKHGELTNWAKSGVLLLNTVLTVRRGMANSHKDKGWEKFTDSVISLLNEREKPVVFLLWGNNAKAKRKLITGKQHLVLASAHPSPLSAYHGFFGCGHFAEANRFLEANGMEPVNWSID